MAKLARYYSLYVTDEEIIKFLESFKDRKANRNRFVIDLLRVAQRFQEEMAKAVGTVEPHPLTGARLSEPQRLEHNQIIEAMNESLQKWKRGEKPDE